ncbi:hypothetical protein V8C37DRAFT_31187 [Trichoderma ceciliae]
MHGTLSSACFVWSGLVWSRISHRLASPCIAFPKPSLASLALSIYWLSGSSAYRLDSSCLCLKRSRAISQKCCSASATYATTAVAKRENNSTSSAKFQLCQLQPFQLLLPTPRAFPNGAAATRLIVVLRLYPLAPTMPRAPDPIARYGPDRRRSMDLFSVLLVPFSPIPRPRDP